LAKRVWYDFLRVFFRLLGVCTCQVRVFGRENIPATGAVLVLSNHQSHLDPILVGLCFDRRLNFVARDTLFGFPPFRWLIYSLDAIPIDREGLGLGGLKESLKRLRAGEILAIFPEGTRTPDGKVGRLKPGFLALARRGKAALLPMAVEGAYDAWPKRNLLPHPAVIHMQLGEALSAAEIEGWEDEAILREIDRRIRAAHATARESRARVAEGGRPLDVAHGKRDAERRKDC
jgi:1-acyl-sn-glycerol-3-phosphate acyltransferase